MFIMIIMLILTTATLCGIINSGRKLQMISRGSSLYISVDGFITSLRNNYFIFLICG